MVLVSIAVQLVTVLYMEGVVFVDDDDDVVVAVASVVNVVVVVVNKVELKDIVVQ